MRRQSAATFAASGALHIALPQATLWHWPAALAAPEADAAFTSLQREVGWQQQQIVIFGRRVPQPRLSAWHGEAEAHYRYSGRDFAPEAWTPTLQALRARVEALCGARFNSVLCNLYRDGQDAMGWHADDERELGPAPQIASLSLGATRRFRLRPRQRDAHPAQTLELGHGSLLLMAGDTQRHWQHALPRMARVREPRINLTFRWVGGR